MAVTLGRRVAPPPMSLLSSVSARRSSLTRSGVGATPSSTCAAPRAQSRRLDINFRERFGLLPIHDVRSENGSPYTGTFGRGGVGKPTEGQRRRHSGEEWCGDFLTAISVQLRSRVPLSRMVPWWVTETTGSPISICPSHLQIFLHGIHLISIWQ